MRDVYGCGIFDYFLDKKIDIRYCLGVSAGSANIASYLARQRGRNLRFYAEYSTRREYMGLHTLFSEGSYFNLNYIYSYLANENGEDPIDIERMKAVDDRFVIAATNAKTGKTEYFTKDDIQKNDMRAVMGGNAGTQTLSIIIRSIALGEVKFTDAWKPFLKEAALGVINGAATGLITGLVAYFMKKIITSSEENEQIQTAPPCGDSFCLLTGVHGGFRKHKFLTV